MLQGWVAMASLCLSSSSEFVAFAMKPEHFGGCSQSVHAGVAPDCSGATFCCSLGYDACCSGEIEHRQTPWHLGLSPAQHVSSPVVLKSMLSLHG